jgi:hypothetical protein
MTAARPDLSVPAARWPPWAREWAAERAGHREAEGEPPLEASEHAREDVLRWVANGGAVPER